MYLIDTKNLTTNVRKLHRDANGNVMAFESEADAVAAMPQLAGLPLIAWIMDRNGEHRGAWDCQDITR